jgi:hypothetical protein
MIKINLKKIYNKLLFKFFIYYQIYLIYYNRTYNFLSKLDIYVKDTISFKF